MQKPTSVCFHEFNEQLFELINNANLPAFVMLPVVRNILNQLESIELNQYQRDLAEWERACKDGGDK